MISLAFIGQHYAKQIEASPEQLSGMDIIYCGGDLQPIEARRIVPRVLVCGLRDLGPDPERRLEALLTGGAERVVVTYDFARREVVDGLRRRGVQVVQGPLSLSNLRTLMTDMIIKDILATQGTQDAPAPAVAAAACPECGATLPEAR